jgi:hypothetical protein
MEWIREIPQIVPVTTRERRARSTRTLAVGLLSSGLGWVAVRLLGSDTEF